MGAVAAEAGHPAHDDEQRAFEGNLGRDRVVVEGEALVVVAAAGTAHAFAEGARGGVGDHENQGKPGAPGCEVPAGSMQ